MNSKTPISALQELIVGSKQILPVYVEEGMVAPFKCTVYIDGITDTGFGATKKAAKHESAANALNRLNPSLGQARENVKNVVVNGSPKSLAQSVTNYVGDLNECATKLKVSYPEYKSIDLPHSSAFAFKCFFCGCTSTGSGLNKKDAKQQAAKSMLQMSHSFKATKIESTVRQPVVVDEKIVELFQSLSVSKNIAEPKALVKKEPSRVSSFDNVDDIENVELLKRKISELGIYYDILVIQSSPYIVGVRLKKIDRCFMGLHEKKESALKTALLDLLASVKSGVDLFSSITFD